MDEGKNTPLLEAVRNSTPHILPLLLLRGANLQHRNSEGQGILHLAAAHADITCIELLQSFGLHRMSTSLLDNNSRTPRDLLAGRVDDPDEKLVAAINNLLDEVDAHTTSEHNESKESVEEYTNDVEYLVPL